MDTVLFFVLHGLVVVIVLYLLWSGSLAAATRIDVAIVRRAELVHAIRAGGKLAARHQLHVPDAEAAQPSPLDYMGPWPVYILAGEVVALARFYVPSGYLSREGQPIVQIGHDADDTSSILSAKMNSISLRTVSGRSRRSF
jgi:hypothetical protein